MNPAVAQETQQPPKKSGIKLQFLPPPMEGTVSLGIYDTTGKFVRTLHREAEKTDLTPAPDGIVTTWDGKDDAGQIAPAGKYRARGFVVGEIKVEGEAFHFNDWIVDDDSPRIRRVAGLASGGTDQLRIKAASADGSTLHLLYDFKKDEIKTESGEAKSAGEASFATRLELTGTNAAKLTILLEETAQKQTVQGSPFEKTIWFSDELAQVKDKLKLADGKPFVPQEKIAVTLRANPLNQDKPGSLEISAGFDANGSFLKTADGLVLRAVSETKNLRWVAIGRGLDAKSFTIFQSDGAVVEQFKISGLREMMAFDGGELEYDPARQK